MKQSILRKILASYFIFAMLGLLIINTISTTQTYNALSEDQASHVYFTASTAAAFVRKAGDVKKADLYHDNVATISIPSSCELWITDTEGTVYYCTTKTNTPDKIENFDIGYFENRFFIAGKFFNCFRSSILTTYSTIEIDETVVGYVFIHMPTAQLSYNSKQVTDIIYFTYFLILFASIILLLAVIYYVFLPLKSIKKATDEYANGHFDYELKYNARDDELGQVANSLSIMAHKLNDVEEFQRKFISNISHDFRSPLTSIKGYLEAIIDGTIPYELQNKYLNIVLSEAERLQKMTNGLLDLNKWGKDSITLTRKDFNLDRLIEGVLQTFEGRSDKAKVSFEFQPNIHIVNGDQAKIQQVLYNLIDNALKFSLPDTSIKINIYSKGDKYFCSIKDAGIGISALDLEKIWTRFYKTDSSRGKDRTGSGIGLSIVKEIINAHGQTIDVKSTENVGTEFIFSLDKAKQY